MVVSSLPIREILGQIEGGVVVLWNVPNARQFHKLNPGQPQMPCGFGRGNAVFIEEPQDRSFQSLVAKVLHGTFVYRPFGNRYGTAQSDCTGL